MNILNKPIDSFSHEDIVAFCKEGFPEGIQVDYKKDFPKKGFAKYFAAFSNTRGGIIIIGVEEDRRSGLPIAWEGVTKDAKQIEKMHQDACNVEPIPSYQVNTTEEVDGKCFVLIRVFEGDKPPYYAQNDSNVWVRTGNISNTIDIASPDWLELLFNKQEQAGKLRNYYIRRANEVFEAGLEREERKRQKYVQDIENQFHSSDGCYKHKLGTDLVLCNIILQPYFPHRVLTSPREIKKSIKELQIRNRYACFPDISMESMPDGLFHFEHSSQNGDIECQQLFSNGLIYITVNINGTDVNGRKAIDLGSVMAHIHIILEYAVKAFNNIGYQGLLEGHILLSNLHEKYIHKLEAPGWFHLSDHDKQNLLTNYKWDLHLDTNILNVSDSLKEYYVSLLHEIYWSFGYEEEMKENFLDAFFKNNNILF
jgi:hypothetical protein